MDQVRLPVDANGNSVAAVPLDDENSIVIELASGSAVSPVLDRGMYELQCIGSPVWMRKTDDGEAAGPYRGRILFPGPDGVYYVPGGRRLGFTMDAALGSAAAVIVLVPVEEV